MQHNDEYNSTGGNNTRNQMMQDQNAKYFLASIVDSLYDSVVTITLEGVITSWNRSAERIYGYPAHEAIGRSFNLLNSDGDFGEVLKKINLIKNGVQGPLYATLGLNKDGRFIQLEITLSPIKNGEGEVIGISIVARDIGEFGKAEEALAGSDSNVRAIIEAAVDFGIITIDEEGIIRDWNSGAEIMLGYRAEEIIGRHTELIFTPEDRHAGIPRIELELAKTRGRSIDERWHLHKDGSRFFMSGVMTPIRHPGRQGYVKIARNITDRKLAEEALLLSEQHKSLAVQSAEMGEWVWELATDQVTISDQVSILLGLPPAQRQISPSSLLERLYPDDRPVFEQELKAAAGGLNVLHTECRILRADNSQIRWVNVYGRIVARAGDRPSKLIGVFYDITPRKVLEKQKDDFIGLASHELKTPLTAIKTFTELLTGNFEEEGDQQKLLLLDKLNGQIDRLISLMQNLLDSSHLSEGGLKLDPVTFDLPAAIDEHMDTIHTIAKRHSFVWKSAAIPLIHADRQRVLQVIDNFITNSAKYSPEGSEIILTVEDQAFQVMVSVQDRGMGIPLEAQQFVFERYFRGEHEKTNKGFGLGLFICAQIIREHHGTIGLQSSPGEGSTFYFTLPYS